MAKNMLEDNESIEKIIKYTGLTKKKQKNYNITLDYQFKNVYDIVVK